MDVMNCKRGSGSAERLKHFVSRYESNVAVSGSFGTITSLVDTSLSVQKALEYVSFEDVASIIRTCDQTNNESGDVRASSSRSGAMKPRMSPEDFDLYMRTQTCHDCRRKGHRKGNKKRPNYDPNYGKTYDDGDDSVNEPKKRSLTFNNARFTNIFTGTSPSSRSPSARTSIFTSNNASIFRSFVSG